MRMEGSHVSDLLEPPGVFRLVPSRFTRDSPVNLEDPNNRAAVGIAAHILGMSGTRRFWLLSSVYSSNSNGWCFG
jgi:hypothetical protein